MGFLRKFYRKYRFSMLAFLSFFLTVILTGILTNLISTLLQMAIGSAINRLAILIVVFIIFSLLLYWIIRKLSEERHRWYPVPREMEPRGHKGLIALVGPGANKMFYTSPEKSPAASALQFHFNKGALKQVWLITSDEGMPVAEALRDEYSKKGVKINICQPVRNILDITETFTLGNQIIQELPSLELQPEDIIADFTGGNTLMSVGLALAALRNGFSMEFMSQVAGSESRPVQVGVNFPWQIDS